jgi:hypothetical protein
VRFLSSRCRDSLSELLQKKEIEKVTKEKKSTAREIKRGDSQFWCDFADVAVPFQNAVAWNGVIASASRNFDLLTLRSQEGKL